MVVALPRGGVPVAAEVAHRLGAPLDVLVVRKLGHPGQPELGIGAIAEGGLSFIDWKWTDRLGVEPEVVHQLVARERANLDRRVIRYRAARDRVPLDGRTVILVDDGLATGATARVAVAAIRRAGGREIVLAVPVAPTEVVAEMRTVADGVVCLEATDDLGSVGDWYDHFEPVSDQEVIGLLNRAAGISVASAPPGHVLGEQRVDVIAGSRLPGTLMMPERPLGLVAFAHGSGSSRLSPRNRQVATALNKAGIATLLFDLLTDDEAADRRNVFDVELLGDRLVAAVRWASDHVGVAMPIGLFGASTGSAAALLAAAHLGGGISAVVSHGGRPDLAERLLPLVSAATLLIVGGHDQTVLDLNRRAAARLTHCEHRVAVIPGATHLFEEPGSLEAVATLAAEWFGGHFRARPQPASA